MTYTARLFSHTDHLCIQVLSNDVLLSAAISLSKNTSQIMLCGERRALRQVPRSYFYMSIKRTNASLAPPSTHKSCSESSWLADFQMASFPGWSFLDWEQICMVVVRTGTRIETHRYNISLTSSGSTVVECSLYYYL